MIDPSPDTIAQAVAIQGVQIAAMHRILTRLLVVLAKDHPQLIEKVKRDYADALEEGRGRVEASLPTHAPSEGSS